IEYTGLRPGEKLFEELLLADNVTRTDHPMIMRAREQSLPWKQVRRLLDDLLSVTKAFDCRRAVRLLSEAVAADRASPELTALVSARRMDLGHDTDNVTDLPARRRLTLSSAGTSASTEKVLGERPAVGP